LQREFRENEERCINREGRKFEYITPLLNRLRSDQRVSFKLADESLGQQWSSTLSASQKARYEEESNSEHNGLSDAIIPNVEQGSKREVDFLSGMKKYIPVPSKISK
jgi:hypothetical protein